MVKNLPTQYIFFLLCCYDTGCPHPVCQSGPPALPYRWYPDGSLLMELPLPVYDPERQWGSTCSSCSGVCSGHYKSVVFTDVSDIATTAQPPSSILKQHFSDIDFNNVTDEFIEQSAKSVLLPVEEVKVWFHHLQTVLTNRKRGATKAAATRQAKQRHASERADRPPLASLP